MTKYSIIDAHIHLYTEQDLPRLNWTANLPRDHPLNRRNSIEQYVRASASRLSDLEGFIFVETDRKSGLKDDEWTDVYNETGFVEGLTSATISEPVTPKLLGIVAWAPIPAGAETLARYIQSAAALSTKIKGVRYLLQNQPAGVMLEPGFLESLIWLGRNNYAFDLGVDARQGGLHQLREGCELLRRLHHISVGSHPRIVVNHLCKPNMRLSVPEIQGGHHEFTEWRECIETIARFQNAYMKLSGLFSELAPQEDSNPTPMDALISRAKPWFEVVFRAFGAHRILFGSDWPVCNVGGPGSEESWSHWVTFVEQLLEDHGCTHDEKQRIWSRTAKEAYGID